MKLAKIKVGAQEVDLDPELLKFSEASINQFLEKFAAHYNYYTEKHADAQFLHRKYEDLYDAKYGEKFKLFKDAGGSDKLCECRCKADPEVLEASESVRIARRNVDLLWGFLRAMDRAHEDAMQMCYNIRKEMDKLWSSVPTTKKKFDDMMGP